MSQLTQVGVVETALPNLCRNGYGSQRLSNKSHRLISFEKHKTPKPLALLNVVLWFSIWCSQSLDGGSVLCNTCWMPR